MTIDKKRFCYQSFHVPKDDENSQFRASNQQKIFNLLDEIAEPLDSPTYAFSTIEETREFVTTHNLKFKSSMTRPFYLTEIGLLCGWYKSLLKFIESDFEYMIIFEDDMWVSQDGKKVTDLILKIINEYLPADAELLNLYVTDVEMRDYLPEYDLNEYVSRGYNYLCCGMLVFPRVGALKLLEVFKNEVTKAVDLIMFRHGDIGMKFYCLNPKIQVDYFSMWSHEWLGSTIDPVKGKFFTEFWDA